MNRTTKTRSKMADLPIWNTDFEPGAKTLWLAYYDGLRWDTRFSFLEILHNFGSRRIPEFEEELIRYGWMTRKGSDLRSVVPGWS